MLDRRLLVLVAASVAAMFIPAAAGAQGVPANAMPNLLRDAAAQVMERPVDDPVTLRRRVIAPDAGAFEAVITGRGLTLNLFDDVSLPVIHDEVRQRGEATWQWLGHVPGMPQRSTIIVLHRGVLWASIAGENLGRYRIRSHAGLGQVVEQIDEDRFDVCGTGERQHARVDGAAALDPQGEAGGIAGAVNCSGPIIDVMIMYSPQARDIEGGVTQIEALAYGLEAATNVTYVNSLVSQRINIVFVGETIDNEVPGFGDNLDLLTDVGEGTFDEVHALRDAFGADLVALLISHTNGGICGIAWLMTNVNPQFAQYGFSVTNTNCAQGGFTFQHELGHNMGCHHDHDNSGPAGAFTWSHGHRFNGTDGIQYRTVMAYAPGTRIPHFSNPEVLYQGAASGVPIGVPNTEAHNTATLNATAATVAAFRVPPPPDIAGGSPPSGWPAPGPIAPNDPDLNDRFGTAVAIDGQIILVSAYLDDEAATDAGAVYVFRFNPATSVWEQEIKLMAPDAQALDRFGVSVDVLDGDDSEVALIGAYLDDDGGRDAGSAYVFRRVGDGAWQFETKLIADDIFGSDTFGRSVSLASTGGSEIALIGSPGDDDAGSGSGSAYVFRKTGASAWTQEQKLVALDAEPGDAFGIAVDVEVAPDGQQLAVIGAWLDDDLGTSAGSAYVFAREASWVQKSKLLADDGALQDQAGFGVALGFPDPTTKLAYMSAWKANAPSSNTGAVYVFAAGPETWTQETKLTASDGMAEDSLGVSIDARDDVLIAGAYFDDEGALDTGSAFIFRRTGTGWVQEAKLVAADGLDNDQMGISVAIDGNRAMAGAWQRDNPALDSGVLQVAGGGSGPTITDCNGNGQEDECDILNGTSPDVNNNGIPDECEAPPCPANIATGPGSETSVNIDDLLAVISGWGPCPTPPAPCPANIATGPGSETSVNIDDLLAVISAWGPCPTVPPG